MTTRNWRRDEPVDVEAVARSRPCSKRNRVAQAGLSVTTKSVSPLWAAHRQWEASSAARLLRSSRVRRKAWSPSAAREDPPSWISERTPVRAAGVGFSPDGSIGTVG